MSEWDEIADRFILGAEDVFDMLMAIYGHHMMGWTDVDPHIEAFVADAKERYERGKAEHADTGTTWEAWTDHDFAANIREEVMDAIIYAAARRIAQEKQQ